MKSLLAGAFAFAVTAQGARAADGPIVTTRDGSVQGLETKGVSAFFGIPYGADTGGQNRFLPPVLVEAWTDVKPATAMGDRCPQPPHLNTGAKTQIITFSDLPISEDCLRLNVWTPRPGASQRPVMVWLHGGGFGFGSAADKYYDGASLARNQDVVVVSLNHRLNAFGYLDLGPEAGPQYATSGNVGMLDIVQALKWVKANAAAFGGDPGNVTIFGQSGGGGKVTVLTAMPSAHGLFQKAIIESGAEIKVPDRTEAMATRDRLLAALDLKPQDVAKLRDLPMLDLVKAAMKAGILTFRPEVDGAVVPTQPFDPVASPVSKDIPIMNGTARDEATDFLLLDPTWPTTTEAVLLALASAMLGGEDKAKAAIATYRRRAPDDTPMHILASIVTDQMFTRKGILLDERKSAQGGAPVYAYRIDWKTPVLDGILRAPHGVELPFVFDTVGVSGDLVGAPPQADSLVKLFQSTFAAFARTGDPNVPGLPHWPAYDARTRATFIYDLPPKVVSDPDPDVRAMLTGQ